MVLGAAIALGAAARTYLVFAKPLWADEIYTLTLAKKSVVEILSALRIDSGPPLHYLLAHLVLLPFGVAPGPADVGVRLVSLAASLLHLPIFLVIARRLGVPALGLRAAALFSLFPLAIDYAAEGRAYALASLFVLLAFERALAVREEPRAGRCVGLALSAGAAVLTHYLAVFPIAALAVLTLRTTAAARRALLLSGAGASALAALWLPIALDQPRASMSWSRTGAFASAPVDFVTNLAIGIQPSGSAAPFLAFLSGGLLVLLLFLSRTSPLAPAAAVLVTAVGLFLVGELLSGSGSLLLAERSALPFLPFTALLLSSVAPAIRFGAAAASALALLLRLPSLTSPTPGELLARVLLPGARRGLSTCAVGLWGPELDYRLARAGASSRVFLFPSSVRAHPGWYREEDLDDDRLEKEAAVVVAASPRPAFYVLPRGSRAAAALARQLEPLHPVRMLTSPIVDVVGVRAR